MGQYQYPPKLALGLVLLNPEGVSALKQLYAEMQQKNQMLYSQLLTAWREMLKLAETVYGVKSRQYKYIKGTPPEAPKDLMKTWQKAVREIEAYRERERLNARRRQLYRNHKAETDKAIAALESAGYVLNQHFSRYTARKFAAEVLIEVEPGRYAGRLLPSGE